MVTLPKYFVATKYPGYFWHMPEQKLYTLKVTGILRPMKYSPPNKFNHFIDGYRVSADGQKTYLYMSYLKQLKLLNSIIPVEK